MKNVNKDYKNAKTKWFVPVEFYQPSPNNPPNAVHHNPVFISGPKLDSLLSVSVSDPVRGLRTLDPKTKDYYGIERLPDYPEPIVEPEFYFDMLSLWFNIQYVHHT